MIKEVTGTLAAIMFAAGSANAFTLGCPLSATTCTTDSFTVTDTLAAITSPPFVYYSGLDSFTFSSSSEFDLSLTGVATTNISGQLFGTGPVPVGFPITSLVLTDLPAGIYTYALLGTALVPGSLTLTATVTAVPEPQTYAMLLAGFGVIGMVGMRRRRMSESKL